LTVDGGGHFTGWIGSSAHESTARRRARGWSLVMTDGRGPCHFAERRIAAMKISYVFDRPLPARETDSEQAMQTIAAFARQGAEVTLVLPEQAEATSARELAAHYQVSGDFDVVARERGSTAARGPRRGRGVHAQLPDAAFARATRPALRL
jgi:hypothetical protein